MFNKPPERESAPNPSCETIGHCHDCIADTGVCCECGARYELPHVKTSRPKWRWFRKRSVEDPQRCAMEHYVRRRARSRRVGRRVRRGVSQPRND